MVTIIAFVIAVLAAIAGITAALVTKKQDGPIEQVCEQIIRAETGIDIDLTPGSSDKGDSSNGNSK